MSQSTETTIMQVRGVGWASSKAVADAVLSRRPGVLGVDTNVVAQTATITFDPRQTSVDDLARWVRECGYHCDGKSVPDHICDPLAASSASPDQIVGRANPAVTAPGHPSPTRDITQPPSDAHTVRAATPTRTKQDAMGHGGGHGSMTMSSMIRDMRNRFL
ncbi:cation transporter, partial [Cryobacterium zhongshanensis]